MALITDAAADWSAPVILDADEVWQARHGSVFLTTSATPDAADGIALHAMHAIHLSSGQVVRYRKEGHTDALIARETV